MESANETQIVHSINVRFKPELLQVKHIALVDVKKTSLQFFTSSYPMNSQMARILISQ